MSDRQLAKELQLRNILAEQIATVFRQCQKIGAERRTRVEEIMNLLGHNVPDDRAAAGATPPVPKAKCETPALATFGSDLTDSSGTYYIPDLAAGYYVEQVTDPFGKVWATKNIGVLGDQGTSLINSEFKFDLQDFLARYPRAPMHSLDEIIQSGKYHPAIEGVIKRANAVESRDADRAEPRLH